MKRTVLAVLVLASLAALPGVPGRHHCTTRSCQPLPAPMAVIRTAAATSSELVMPRSPGISVRDCVGLPRPAAGSPQVPSPMIAGRLV